MPYNCRLLVITEIFWNCGRNLISSALFPFMLKTKLSPNVSFFDDRLKFSWNKFWICYDDQFGRTISDFFSPWSINYQKSMLTYYSPRNISNVYVRKSLLMSTFQQIMTLMPNCIVLASFFFDFVHFGTTEVRNSRNLTLHQLWAVYAPRCSWSSTYSPNKFLCDLVSFCTSALSHPFMTNF